MTSSPLLNRPDAVEGAGIDAGVAAHYGDPTGEQRRLLRGEAVADLSHFGVVTVTGEDRLSWLNSLSSQLLLGLEPGVSVQSLLLTVQGRIEHDLRLVDDGETSWLIVEPGQAPAVAAWLDRMRFMLRVSVADVSADYAVVGSCAPVSAFAGLTCWSDPWPGIVSGGYAYSAGEHPGAERPWFEYLVPRSGLESATASMKLSGMMAVEALRIAAWRPRAGVDTDDKTIPHELDLMRTAVHLDKGCYKGQETIARVHNLGHPPRRLVFLHLDGSMHTLPAPGSEVKLGEKAVGRITSATLHFEAGPIALAMIKRNVDPAAVLNVIDGEDSYPAAQELIVATDAGQVLGRKTGFLRGGPRS